MNLSRRVVSVTVALAAGVTLLAIAAGANASKHATVTLLVWDQEVHGGQNAAITQLNKAFQKKYPDIKINRVAKSFTDLQATLKLAASGPNPPDVVEANKAVHEDGERLCAEVVKLAERAGVKAEGHAVGGEPADALIRVAEDAGAELIVVGNRGMTGKRRLLGSIPNKVAHHCSKSVLIVDTHEARDNK